MALKWNQAEIPVANLAIYHPHENILGLKPLPVAI